MPVPGALLSTKLPNTNLSTALDATG